ARLAVRAEVLCRSPLARRGGADRKSLPLFFGTRFCSSARDCGGAAAPSISAFRVAPALYHARRFPCLTHAKDFHDESIARPPRRGGAPCRSRVSCLSPPLSPPSLSPPSRPGARQRPRIGRWVRRADRLAA